MMSPATEELALTLVPVELLLLRLALALAAMLPRVEHVLQLQLLARLVLLVFPALLQLQVVAEL